MTDDKWQKLRNWLSHLLVEPAVKKGEKEGIKTALRIMDRIEEMEKTDQ